MDDIGSEEDDEDDKAASRPYMALLQSFNDAGDSRAKRRKLEHRDSPISKTDQTPLNGESDDESSVGDSDDEEEVKDIDRADEELEGVEQGPEEHMEDDDDSEDEENPTDPFDVHYAHPDDDAIAKKIKAVQKGDWTTKRALVQTMRATVMSPASDSSPEASKPIAGLEGLQLKQKLKELAASKIGSFTPTQKAISSALFDYRDILYCDRTARNSNELRQLTCLHALNHVFKYVLPISQGQSFIANRVPGRETE